MDSLFLLLVFVIIVISVSYFVILLFYYFFILGPVKASLEDSVIFDDHCYWYLLDFSSTRDIASNIVMPSMHPSSIAIIHRTHDKVSFKCLVYSMSIACICYYLSSAIDPIHLLHLHLSSIAYYFSWIIYIVSYIVMVYSIDYVDVFDWYPFYIFIAYFYFGMIFFVYCNDYLSCLLYWELLGLSSYLLPNFWSNKNHCGIMALIYNKLGDILLLFCIVLSYCSMFSFDFELILLFLFYYYIYYSIVLLVLILALIIKLA